MQLGKTIIGAIIGAALGIGLLVAVQHFAKRDDVWMAIPVAVLTGLGVRMVVSTSGRASYLRGALTVLLALGAYFGGLQITKVVANQLAAKAKEPHVSKDASEKKPGEGEEGKVEELDAEPPAPIPAVPAPKLPEAGVPRPALQRDLSAWDFISLAVAALLAYELGRGSGGVRREGMDTMPDERMPAGTHPDA